MRLGKIALLSAFICASMANAQDVMVDLRVLDDLEEPQTVNMNPLFPVLSKKTDAKIKKSTPPRNKVSKKSQTKLKTESLAKKVKPLDADAVVVDVEPVTLPAEKFEKVSKTSVGVKTADTTSQPVAVAKIEKEIAPKEVVNEPSKEVVKETPKEVVKETPKEVVTETPKEVVSSNSVETEDELLIKADTTEIENDDYIKFTKDIDELNEEQMIQIDSIVSAYKNAPNNKIAIYSYNYDNGVDSFKKKRTSLNRAVNIRSYLLKKGYKNFSIKVINTNNASDKQNIVELKEI